MRPGGRPSTPPLDTAAPLGETRAMRARGVVVVALLSLLAIGLTGCLLPGREGWECKEHADCSSGMKCRTYHGGGKSKSFCTKAGKSSITTDETYNWFHVIAGWAMIVGLPGGSAIAILVSRRRTKKKGATPPPPQPGSPAA